MSTPPLLEARGLVRTYAARRKGAAPVRAVDGVDLDVREGEFVGLVGESGSGKSTLGRMLVRLLEPDRGAVRFAGEDVSARTGRALRELRREFQFVFQDAHGALNPRMRVGDLVGEPLIVHRIGDGGEDRRRRVAALLEEVGLDAGAARRYPHEFSGGQRQRIGIARAIACGPRLLVADEPVSALDPPVQAQIIRLLLDLRNRHGMAVVLIAHDLALVRRVCDRVAVMYLGRIVEDGPADAVCGSPLHPYTRVLLASVPRRVPGGGPAQAPQGEPPSASAIPPGCRFHPRCPDAIDRCRREDPASERFPGGRRVACLRAGEAADGSGAGSR